MYAQYSDLRCGTMVWDSDAKRIKALSLLEYRQTQVLVSVVKILISFSSAGNSWKDYGRSPSWSIPDVFTSLSLRDIVLIFSEGRPVVQILMTDFEVLPHPAWNSTLRKSGQNFPDSQEQFFEKVNLYCCMSKPYNSPPLWVRIPLQPWKWLLTCNDFYLHFLHMRAWLLPIDWFQRLPWITKTN